MTTKRITAALLRKHNACKRQVEIFEAEWPEGAEPTEANLQRAVVLELEIGWLAHHLLWSPHLVIYEAARAPHLAAYEAARDQNWAIFEAACAPHLAIYKAAHDQHLAAYKAACAPHLIAYRAARDRHWAAYQAACGAEFIRQWKLQGAGKVPA